MDSPKYAKFDVLQTTYKVVNSHKINAFVFSPKNLPPGKYPVMVKFHGGFFCTGASEYADWFRQWALDYCFLHSAIIVAADYRLMPESNGLDIMDDICHFWKWIRSDLPDYLTKSVPGIEADLSKVIAYGDSAGGYLAIQSGLRQPFGTIKAIIATYPVINPGAITGPSTLIPSVLDNHLNAMKPGEIVTSAFPPHRMDLGLLLAQQGRMPEFFGTDESLFLMKAMEKAKETPFVFILHGEDDDIVPIEGSFQFEEAVKKEFGFGKVMLHTAPGGHGFDRDATLETPWLREGLRKVAELWLR